MAAAFPRRLFEILSTEDKSVISWNADGKSFRINDTNLFCNDILPRYFRHCKLTSFQVYILSNQSPFAIFIFVLLANSYVCVHILSFLLPSCIYYFK
jgi:hypothetical protein